MRNYAKLKEEILNPIYDNMTDQEIADKLNAKTITVQREKRLTALGVMKVLGAAEGSNFLDTLEVISLKNAAVKWAMSGITFSGVDMSDTTTIAMLDELALAGAIQQSQADKLKASADVLISRAEEIGLYNVSVGKIIDARKN